MPETTPLIKAALNLRAGAGFDVYDSRTYFIKCNEWGRGEEKWKNKVSLCPFL